jgi:hypothetical protein
VSTSDFFRAYSRGTGRKARAAFRREDFQRQLPQLKDFLAEIGAELRVLNHGNQIHFRFGRLLANYYPETKAYFVQRPAVGPTLHLDPNTAIRAFLDEAARSTGRKQVIFREKQPEQLVEVVPSLVDVNDELVRYLAAHPEFLFKLTSRRFEELIATLLEDHGFDVELTPATRDRGKDILAWIQNSITSLLVFVECKRYRPDRPVGVGVIRSVVGTQRIYQANKSLVVTTSYFSRPAREEQRLVERQLDLKDYNDVVAWLRQFGAGAPRNAG